MNPVFQGLRVRRVLGGHTVCDLSTTQAPVHTTAVPPLVAEGNWQDDRIHGDRILVRSPPDDSSGTPYSSPRHDRPAGVSPQLQRTGATIRSIRQMPPQVQLN